MTKLREALVAARTRMAAQQSRITQLTMELASAKQSRISTDLTGSVSFRGVSTCELIRSLF